MSNIEQIVRESFARVLDEADVQPAGIDLSRDMAEDYGLTSLNKILLITAACDDAQVELFHFTEQDVAGMRTLRDVVDALSRVAVPVQ